VIEKEVMNGVVLKQELSILFEQTMTQCEDCRKSFTPHVYTCKVQVRQHSLPHELKRNMLFLEQLILKHNAHVFCSAVETFAEGVDFKFTDPK